jgi:hypothetical protein
MSAGQCIRQTMLSNDLHDRLPRKVATFVKFLERSQIEKNACTGESYIEESRVDMNLDFVHSMAYARFDTEYRNLSERRENQQTAAFCDILSAEYLVCCCSVGVVSFFGATLSFAVH